MTPSELKYQHETVCPESYFFDHKTMRFFGDTMRNYGVRSATVPYHWDETGNNYLETPRMVEAWELYRKRAVNGGLKSSAYFCKQTFRQIHVSR